MRFRDTLRLALEALSAHRLRTALTLLGLVVGVTSLILVMTLIQGANGYVKTKKFRELTMDDSRSIVERCPACLAVGVQARTTGEIRGPERSLVDVTLRGE